MSASFQKTSNGSNKQMLDVTVVPLYNKNGTTAFKVHIKQGKFIVIDYKDRFGKNPDTEIFWEHGVCFMSKHTSEYKAADKAVAAFLKDKLINKK